MEHILKQIDNFKKQNDGMETAFNTKNISFNKNLKMSQKNYLWLIK